MLATDSAQAVESRLRTCSLASEPASGTAVPNEPIRAPEGACSADGSYDEPVAGSRDVANGGAFSGDPQVLMGLFLANPTGVGTIPVVPEPQTWALMAIGLAGIVLVRRRRCVTRA